MSGRPDPAGALAHGTAARFVDEVIEVGDGAIVCGGSVPGHSPAVVDGAAGSWATLELAAQAAALLQSATPEKEGEAVSGYLVRVRDARFARTTVPADRRLVVRVERAGGAGPLSLFDVRVELDGEEIVTAGLGTFQTTT